MSTALYENQRQELIERIQEYDAMIKTYRKDDLPKDGDDLDKLTLDELKDWLNMRVTQYQMQIESDIELSSSGCCSGGSCSC